MTYSLPGPPPLTGSAKVVLARTSLPPWRSVIPIPKRTPSFAKAGIDRGSYTEERARCSHSVASSGCRRSDGIAANVIVNRQLVPSSIWCRSITDAARDMRSRPLFYPRQGMSLRCDPDAHQLMIRRVIDHLVNAIAEAIVRSQFRCKSIGQHAQVYRLRLAQ